MRCAAVDIGTNTVLLLVAERDASGALVAIEERATITRLGQGVDRTGVLAPEAVARTIACLLGYASVARGLGVDRTGVVGTSAMRDAGGGEEVRAAVLRAFGVDARVLSGDEEARLTFLGAISGLEVDTSSELAVFDIGGGSTEVVLGVPSPSLTIRFARSFDVGSVRLTERFVRSDPPSTADRAAVDRFTREAIASVPPLPAGATPIGIAGTMTTLAAVSLAMPVYDGARVHGSLLTRTDIGAVVDRLASVDLETRRTVTGMEPKRADVIVAGASIALAMLDHWGASAARISDRGVRWGLAAELAG
ncbi:MAG TPA: Ppx/GppA phosphatase family protein [Polyangiaceae bacterium]|jgi:exopolyphosphatase/guanosine-5'-triphosphate,3'-diphosphate pyrophosphatase